MIGLAAAEIRGYTPPKLNIVMSQVYNFMRVPHIFLLGVKSISSEAQGEGIKMTEEVRLCFMHAAIYNQHYLNMTQLRSFIAFLPLYFTVPVSGYASFFLYIFSLASATQRD